MSDTATDTVTEETAAPSTGDSTEEQTEQPQQPDAASAPAEGDAEALGDAGKKALDAMKADRNKYRDELKTLRDEMAALRAAAEGREAEHQAAVEAQRLKDEALAAANTKILKANLRAAAAGKLADPTDALTFIDVSSFEVDDDGNTDEGALKAAIDDLIASKPYLAAQGKRFQGDADGGARKESSPGQLTREDVQRLASEGKHDEIVRAKEEGRLSNLLSAS